MIDQASNQKRPLRNRPSGIPRGPVPSSHDRARPGGLLTAGQIAVLASIIVCLYAVVVCAPWQMRMPLNSLDGSWGLLLNVAFARHLHFGSDIIFTYGPWGFLEGSWYYPQTYHLFMLIWVSIEIVVAASVWHVGRVRFQRRAAAFVWSLVLVTALAPFLASRDAFFLFLPLLYALLLLEPESSQSWQLRVSLVTVLALAGLVKLTFLVIAVLVVACGSVYTSIRFRKMSWDAPVFALGLCVFWLLAGQSLSLFGAFLVNAASIVSGYTAAMSLFKSHPAWLGVFTAAALGLGWVVATVPKMRRFDTVFLSCTLVAVIYEAFKEGFIREDNMHANVSFQILFLVLLMVFPLRWNEGRRDRRILGVAVLIAVIVGAMAASWRIPPFSRLRGLNVPGTSWVNLKVAASTTFGGDPYRSAYHEAAARIRHDQPLPAIPGTVDIYSPDLAGVILSGLRYTPRPVFQSYCAYTPRLSQINRSFLDCPLAPDWILFGMKTIDGRYPTLDDGPSWPALLSRYRVTGTAGDLLILQRWPDPRNVILAPMETISGDLGRPLRLPTAKDHGVIWAQIDLHETMSYRLAEALYKPAEVYIQVVTVGGTTKTYRLIPAMARTGFLLAPLIDSSLQFGELSEGKWPANLANQQIASLTIRYSGGLTKLARILPGYDVHLSRLVVP